MTAGVRQRAAGTVDIIAGAFRVETLPQAACNVSRTSQKDEKDKNGLHSNYFSSSISLFSLKQYRYLHHGGRDNPRYGSGVESCGDGPAPASCLVFNRHDGGQTGEVE